MACIHREKKIQKKKKKKTLTGSAKHTENRGAKIILKN